MGTCPTRKYKYHSANRISAILGCEPCRIGVLLDESRIGERTIIFSQARFMWYSPNYTQRTVLTHWTSSVYL